MTSPLTPSQAQALQERVAVLEAEKERLQVSELRYRQVFENAPISMLLANREGYVIAMNATAEDLYGLTAEQLNQSACPIFDNPQLVESGTLHYMQRALAGEAVIEPPSYYDSSRDAGSGKFHYGRGHYAPIRDGAGVVEGFVEIAPRCHDFFELQAQLLEEKERAAQERARLLSTVAEVAHRLLRAPDYGAVLPEVVRLLGEAMGCDRCAITQDFIDPTTHQFRVRLLHEWCREGIPSALLISPGFDEGLEIDSPPSFRAQLMQGESVNFVVSETSELSWRNFFEAHGNTAMLLVPVMINGQCWGHIGFDNCSEPRLHDDVEIAILRVAAESIAAAIDRQRKDDALRESERHYRTLFEMSNEGIYRFEFEEPIALALSVEDRLRLGCETNRLVEVNQAFAEQYGLTSPDEMVGTRIGDFYDGAYVQANEQANLALMRDLRASKLETVETDRLGNRHWFISSLVFETCDGYLLGGWGVQTDITDLKQAQQAQQALLEAEQAKSQELDQLNLELRQTLTELEGRDRMLTTVADATKDLLKGSSTDLDRMIPAALQVLGEGMGCDRVNVVENFDLSATQVPGHTKVIYGWAEPETIPPLPNPDATQIDCEGLEAFTEHYLQNNGFGGLVDDWPDPLRSAFKAIGLQSSYSVPIWLGEKFWGIVSFDYCHDPKQVSPAEMAILRTAAACIGGAIQRDRTQKAILQTEQALLKAEKARAAKLIQTNQALKNSLDRLAAEPSLDAFLGHVLTEISQLLNIHTSFLYQHDPTTETLQLSRWLDQGNLRSPESFTEMGPMAGPITTRDTAIWTHLLKTHYPFVITPDNAAQYMFPGTGDWQHQWVEQHGFQAGINILLIIGGMPLGLLCLLSAERSDFDPEELEHAQAISQQATLAIQLTHLAEEAKQAALISDRNRMAREIHDTLAQSFGGIVIQLQAAESCNSEPHKARNHISSAQKLAEAGLNEARRTVWLLHQGDLTDQDFPRLLTKIIEQMTAHTDLRVSIDVTGTPSALVPGISTNLVRIVQESIHNILRHAQATTSHIRLIYKPGQICLSIRDNGCGFDPQQLQQCQEGFGLTGMQQRARNLKTHLHINSRLGYGTEILLTVPLKPASNAEVR